jgi:hypothetical protein
MTNRWTFFFLGAALALSGCGRSQRPALEEFGKFPRAHGNVLSGWTGVAGAATPAMVVERFGQPAKTEDVTGMALPNRLIYYHAQDETGKPVLAKLRFISVCKPESANTDCYRLSEVSAAPAQ